MEKLKLTIVFSLLIFLLSSCLTTKQTNLLQEPGGSIPSYPSVEGIGEYHIKSGDELVVRISVPAYNAAMASLFSLFSSGRVSGDDATSRLSSFTVDPSGNIYFPYLGDISVKGKTTLEIQQQLEEKINREILADDGCIVHVSLGNRYFSVIGEARASRYPIAKEQLTIYQALSESQDINPYGDRSQVKIIRKTEEGTLIKTFDLRSTDIVNSDFYYIQPNDVIYIQPLQRQFWGINSFGAVFAIITTITSLGITIYNLAK